MEYTDKEIRKVIKDYEDDLINRGKLQERERIMKIIDDLPLTATISYKHKLKKQIKEELKKEVEKK